MSIFKNESEIRYLMELGILEECIEAYCKGFEKGFEIGFVKGFREGQRKAREDEMAGNSDYGPDLS